VNLKIFEDLLPGTNGNAAFVSPSQDRNRAGSLGRLSSRGSSDSKDGICRMFSHFVHIREFAVIKWYRLC